MSCSLLSFRHIFASLCLVICLSIYASGQTPQRIDQDIPSINVKLQCGAVGDGKVDDTLAIQRALDMAAGDTHLRFPESPRVATRHVYLPPGQYRITRTLLMTSAHTNLTLQGAGSYGGAIRAMSQLIWDGPENGILMQSYGQLGLNMSDIRFDGSHKAATAFALDSIDKDTADPTLLKTYGARAGALLVISRCAFENAGVGFRCGQDSWTCASDMSFYDCNFSNCQTGFLTMADQNLNYLFMRPNIGMSNIGIHFAKGGSATINQLNGHSLRTALRIDKGGINAGIFSIHGMRIESRPFAGYSKISGGSFMVPGEPDSNEIRRTSLIEATGETNIYISGLLTTCMGIVGKNGDPKTPMIRLRDGAQLTIDASQFSGMIADLSTSDGKPPAWMSLRDCRFRFLADPRTNIRCDANSGYELRNSIIFNDHVDPDKGYRIDGWEFVKKIQKLPLIMKH